MVGGDWVKHSHILPVRKINLSLICEFKVPHVETAENNEASILSRFVRLYVAGPKLSHFYTDLSKNIGSLFVFITYFSKFFKVSIFKGP